MPIFLRQSTASQEIPLGYFVDSTDGNTAETALTIANTDIDIWKTGATTLADKNSGGATHIAGGIYYCVLDATDTDTIGPLVVYCKVSGALATRTECCVLDEAVYDSLFGTAALITSGTGTGQLSVTSGVASANVTQWLGSAAATPTVAGVPEVDVTHWIGTAAATPTTAGVPEVDVTHWLGTAAATPTTAGVPEVDLTHIAGSAVSTTTAQLGVNVVGLSATGYQDGAVWLDTVNGTAGTTLWTNGVAHLPCNTIANALTVCAALGVKKIRVVNGSSVTFAASMAGYSLIGEQWTLALGGQAIDGATITGADVSGTASGTTTAYFTSCTFIDATLPGFIAKNCTFTSTVTLANTATGYFMNDCRGSTSSMTFPRFAYAANSEIYVQGWHGTIVIASMASGNQLRLSGSGKLLLQAGCTGGTARVYGTFELENLGSGMTIVDTGRWAEDQSIASIATGGITAASFAAGAVDAAALAADAVNEIWAKAMSDLAAVPAINASVLDAVNFLFCLSRNAITQTATTSSLKRDDATTNIGTSTVSDDGTTFSRGEWT